MATTWEAAAARIGEKVASAEDLEADQGHRPRDSQAADGDRVADRRVERMERGEASAVARAAMRYARVEYCDGRLILHMLLVRGASGRRVKVYACLNRVSIWISGLLASNRRRREFIIVDEKFASTLKP